MNEVQTIQRLDATAERLPSRRIDVTQSVLATIAASRPQTAGSVHIPPYGLATAAALAALLVAGLAWQDWSSCLDPLHGLFGPFAMVMQ